MFHVGQLILCVNDQFVFGRVYPGEVAKSISSPVKGRVYTVRESFVGAFSYSDGAPALELPALLLDEIRNPVFTFEPSPGVRYRREFYFAQRRFRPLDEARLDVFRKMLEPTDA